MAFCPNCGAQLTAGVNNCAACGKPVGQSAGGGAAAAPAPVAAGGLQDNVAGALSYVTIIPAIVFLVLEPYNRNKFIRFHAFQCVFLTVAIIAIDIILGFVPVVGWILLPFVGLAGLVLHIVCALKAYGNQTFKLPVIGDLAEKQANG